MRAIRTAVKGLVPLAAIVALMAIPSVASAAPAKWTDSGGTPLGSPVTVNFTGTFGVKLLAVGPANPHATCQVTGQAELSNGGAGGTATQKIIGMQISGPVGSVCTGGWYGCPPSQVTYGSPWTGATTLNAGVYKSQFTNILVNLQWCGAGGFSASVSGALDAMYPFNVAGGCVGGFYIPNVLKPSSPGNLYNSEISGTLTFAAGGPCVKAAAA